MAVESKRLERSSNGGPIEVLIMLQLACTRLYPLKLAAWGAHVGVTARKIIFCLFVGFMLRPPTSTLPFPRLKYVYLICNSMVSLDAAPDSDFLDRTNYTPR